VVSGVKDTSQGAAMLLSYFGHMPLTSGETVGKTEQAAASVALNGARTAMVNRAFC
jgi:hypothetical protein